MVKRNNKCEWITQTLFNKEGYLDNGIAVHTNFEDLPANLLCPRWKQIKDKFIEYFIK